MKKLFLVFFVLMLLLCACSPETDGSTRPQSSNVSSGSDSGISSATSDKIHTVSETNSEKVTNIYVIRDGNGHYLPNEYEYPIKSVLYSGEWSDAPADCLCDFTIRFTGEVFNYHSECGTVVFNGRSKRLNDYDKANLNDLLFSLFETTQDDNGNTGASKDNESSDSRESSADDESQA